MTHVETAWVISRLLDDITALTAERDAALDEVERLRGVVAAMVGEVDDMVGEVDDALAECERLRAALAAQKEPTP
jgi:arylsulfatase A-like enzyme